VTSFTRNDDRQSQGQLPAPSPAYSQVQLGVNVPL
jgi:hypothetical protein